MSSFPGFFPSLPGIRCDRFSETRLGPQVEGTGAGSDQERSNERGEQFFLSHCHEDHMKGLRHLGSYLDLHWPEGEKARSRLNCTAISRDLVLSHFKDSISLDHISVVHLNCPKIIKIENVVEPYSLRVTALNANHCPGSVMFLFEKLGGDGQVELRVLYTGDFRLEDEKEFKSCTGLLHSDQGPLVLDEMYLDTTFLRPHYPTFPSRKAAVDKVWELCTEWVGKNNVLRRGKRKGELNDRFVVVLHTPARYGYEKLFSEIWSRSRYEWPIHIKDWKSTNYFCDESLGECTASDQQWARHVHACQEPVGRYFDPEHLKNRLTCRDVSEGAISVRHIKLSATYFSQQDELEERLSVHLGKKPVDCHRVCYSTHSSLAELKRFIKQLAPKKVIPCVVPDGAKEEFQKFFQEVLQTCGVVVEGEVETEPEGEIKTESEGEIKIEVERTKEDNKREGMLENKVEVEVERTKEEEAVGYFCFSCSQEMPGVAAGMTCPACDSEFIVQQPPAPGKRKREVSPECSNSDPDSLKLELEESPEKRQRQLNDTPDLEEYEKIARADSKLSANGFTLPYIELLKQERDEAVIVID